MLAGFGVRRLLASARRHTDRLAGFCRSPSIASVVNVWPVLPLRPGLVASRRRSTAPSPGRAHVVLAEFPVVADYAYNTPYMYFALWHWAPMINGYSGFMPKSYEEFQLGVADFPGPGVACDTHEAPGRDARDGQLRVSIAAAATQLLDAARRDAGPAQGSRGALAGAARSGCTSWCDDQLAGAARAGSHRRWTPSTAICAALGLSSSAPGPTARSSISVAVA